MPKKPESLIQIEKYYNVTLDEGSIATFLDDKISSNKYSVDSENVLNGISFPNGDINDISPLAELNLEYINLTNNKVEDISSLLPNDNLKYLFLGGNNISDVSFISKFPNLIELAIWSNPIEDFSPFVNAKMLEALYCQDCGSPNIEYLKELKTLKKLYADDNNITDITHFAHFETLQELLLSDNYITDITHLENLKNLKRLFIRGNLIEKIPQKIAKKFNWLRDAFNSGNYEERTIDIAGNPLMFPPASVIELGELTTKNYYSATDTYGYAPLSEGRIIVIGDGSAGKSSLIERILYDTFELGKTQTNGIKIENWLLKHNDGRELTFHIWDFGGQEIQHAVHKFFFTEGCLYILVLDNRKEEEPEYWLQQIESLGGGAPVFVVFNKQDDNISEIADRKFLKEKYPNIIQFHNTSCKTGFGIKDLRDSLEQQVVQLRTVNEAFPNNWFKIKKAIEERTSGDQYYLDYERYNEICDNNNAVDEETQKLLLKYFTTIGAVTWFGDTYLTFMQVLSPAWITQGVYKILTAKKTATLFGGIHIDDFRELLKPTSDKDYIYEDKHYGYILSMMKKFDLCYTPDDKQILIPSAFGKEPKVEYSEFRGEGIRTYILQFKDYMPLALIHRFITKKLADVFENNYWYSGIVMLDKKSQVLTMVHADKEAKRIYVRIKGNSPLGMWEHVRRELDGIASSYANINYDELVLLENAGDNTVAYDDLISHIQANKSVFFHAKLQEDFNVGYLIGLFEQKESTIEKFKKLETILPDETFEKRSPRSQNVVVNILNNNSPNVNAISNNNINIDIDIQTVNNISNDVKGDATYLLEELKQSNTGLSESLKKIIQFAEDAKTSQNRGNVKEKGWGRKLKGILETIVKGADDLKKLSEGGEALKGMIKGLEHLANQFDLKDIETLAKSVYHMIL